METLRNLPEKVAEDETYSISFIEKLRNALRVYKKESGLGHSALHIEMSKVLGEKLYFDTCHKNLQNFITGKIGVPHRVRLRAYTTFLERVRPVLAETLDDDKKKILFGNMLESVEFLGSFHPSEKLLKGMDGNIYFADTEEVLNFYLTPANFSLLKLFRIQGTCYFEFVLLECSTDCADEIIPILDSAGPYGYQPFTRPYPKDWMLRIYLANVNDDFDESLRSYRRYISLIEYFSLNEDKFFLKNVVSGTLCPTANEAFFGIGNSIAREPFHLMLDFKYLKEIDSDVEAIEIDRVFLNAYSHFKRKEKEFKFIPEDFSENLHGIFDYFLTK